MDGVKEERMTYKRYKQHYADCKTICGITTKAQRPLLCWSLLGV